MVAENQRRSLSPASPSQDQAPPPRPEIGKSQGHKQNSENAADPQVILRLFQVNLLRVHYSLPTVRSVCMFLLALNSLTGSERKPTRTSAVSDVRDFTDRVQHAQKTGF